MHHQRSRTPQLEQSSTRFKVRFILRTQSCYFIIWTVRCSSSSSFLACRYFQRVADHRWLGYHPPNEDDGQSACFHHRFWQCKSLCCALILYFHPFCWNRCAVLLLSPGEDPVRWEGRSSGECQHYGIKRDYPYDWWAAVPTFHPSYPASPLWYHQE